MSYTFFSIAVHSSVGLTKEEYYFVYKDVEFKYKPSFKTGDTDFFTGRFKSHDEDFCYSLMTEFLSSFALSGDYEIIPQPGLSTRLNCSLKKYTGGFSTKRRIPVNEMLAEFYYIIPIRTADQSTLVRLYRQALATKDVYYSILLFWHALVYPSSNDNDAVEFTNLTVGKILSGELLGLDFLRDNIERIYTQKIFSPLEPVSDLGTYFREGVRNSIAHIVRNRPNTKSLDVDLLSEIRHLHDVKAVVGQVAKQRLETQFDLKKSWDETIFRYFIPE